tara:strand:- start:7382 stop:7660 length:279 start_codon:yes stop_codon:yes gene_type:complete
MSRFGQFIKSVQLIIGAVLAGYTAQNIPKKYMDYTSHPISQFIIYYLLFNQSHSNNVPRSWIFIDAVIFTLFINITIELIKMHNHYQENKKD